MYRKENRAGIVKSIAPLKVLLDGETQAQSFPYNADIEFNVDDRVLCLPQGSSFVVAFKIGGVK